MRGMEPAGHGTPTLEDLLRDFRRRFHNGTFRIRVDDPLRATVRSAQVPDAYGLYLVRPESGSDGDLLYVGRSGTIRTDGTPSTQTLPRRLTNRHGGMRREAHFRLVMRDRELQALEIEWFVTVSSERLLLPALVEARVLQAYLDRHGRLPPLNKAA